MPKKNSSERNETKPKGEAYEDIPFSELPRHTQLERAKAAQKIATTNLRAARKAGDKKKEEGASKAWSAANRVINRLGEPPSPKGSPQGQSSGGSKSKKKKKQTMSLSDIARIARQKREAQQNR